MQLFSVFLKKTRLAYVLRGCQGLDGQGVNPLPERPLQKVMNHTVAFNPGKPLKSRGNDFKAEMGLPALPVTRVPDMPVAFIDQRYFNRIKGLHKFFPDFPCYIHEEPYIRI